jgi:hypothetical protein
MFRVEEEGRVEGSFQSFAPCPCQFAKSRRTAHQPHATSFNTTSFFHPLQIQRFGEQRHSSFIPQHNTNPTYRAEYAQYYVRSTVVCARESGGLEARLTLVLAAHVPLYWVETGPHQWTDNGSTLAGAVV